MAYLETAQLSESFPPIIAPANASEPPGMCSTPASWWVGRRSRRGPRALPGTSAEASMLQMGTRGRESEHRQKQTCDHTMGGTTDKGPHAPGSTGGRHSEGLARAEGGEFCSQKARRTCTFSEVRHGCAHSLCCARICTRGHSSTPLRRALPHSLGVMKHLTL